jgi:Xaa-Pro aminopeptidase
MPFDHEARLRTAAERTAEAGMAALIVTPGPDLLYLAGYDAPPLERLTALVVRPYSDPLLFVPELERPRAQASPLGAVLETATWSDEDRPYALVRSALDRPGDGALRIGVSDRTWASHVLALQRELSPVTLEPASTVLSPMRARKDPEEITALREAASAADETFRRIVREGFAGRTEAEVAGSLSRHLVDAGHDTAVFAIVGSGPNGSSPHHEPSDRRIVVGDAVVLDFGGRVRGYCSDMTRTVSIGDPPEEVREVHEIVERAQAAGFAAIRPGTPAEEVDRTVREVIREHGYGGTFVHRTGHGIGLEEHEPPYIVEGGGGALEPGMTFSVEPGIYLPDRFGVRIEDIVVVTDDGVEVLNQAPRDLAAIR